MQTILIIDDSVTHRAFAKSCLEREYTVLEAAGGYGGLALADAHPPDLFLLDVVMPELDGEKTLQMIRGHPKLRAIPVIMLTSVSDKKRVLEILKSGANGYVIKPYLPAKLKERIARILGSTSVSERSPQAPEGPPTVQAGTALSPPPDAAATPQPATPTPAAAPTTAPAATAPLASEVSVGEGTSESVRYSLDLQAVTFFRKAVRSLEIFALPNSYVNRLLVLSGDARKSQAVISEIADRKPKLAANILKLASCGFAGAGTLATMQDAMESLGLARVRKLVHLVELATLFPRRESTLLPDRAFWSHAVAVGVACEAIAAQKPVVDENAYFNGLVHDIGKLVLDRFFPEEYQPVHALMQAEGIPAFDAEMRTLGLCHGHIGNWAMVRWGLSQEITDGIRFHNDPQTMTKLTSDVCMQYLANAIVHGVFEKEESAELIFSGLNPAVVTFEGYTSAKVAEVVTQLQAKAQGILQLIEPLDEVLAKS